MVIEVKIIEEKEIGQQQVVIVKNGQINHLTNIVEDHFLKNVFQEDIL